MRSRWHLLPWLLICVLLCSGAVVYYTVTWKQLTVNGGAAGAAGSNALSVTSPGMLEATRPSFACSWATPVTSGDFCKFTAFTMATSIGVVMPRAGSITGFTVQCNIVTFSAGTQPRFKFYLDGTAFPHDSLDGAHDIDSLGSGDTWDSTGVKERYVTIARNATDATFTAGQYISIDLNEGTLSLETCNLLIEFTLDN